MPVPRDDFLSEYFDIDTAGVGLAPTPDLLEEETEVPPADIKRDDFLSEYFDVKPEAAYVDTVQVKPETVLSGMINRTEWDDVTEGTYPVSFPSVSEETERHVGLVSRMVNRFAEGAIPLPTGDFFEVPEASGRLEMWADVLASFAGIGVGLIIPSILVGTGGGAPAGAVGVALQATKISKARKAYQLMKSGSVMLAQANKGGKGAAAAKKLAYANANKADKLLGEAGLAYEHIAGSGLLAKIPGYTDWLLSMGANESKLLKAIPILKNASGAKVAAAANLGIRNIGTFVAYGQAKLPWFDTSMTERMQTMTADAASSVIFTVAGLPRIKGLKGFADKATLGSKVRAHSLEATTLLGIGMFAGDVGIAAAKGVGADIKFPGELDFKESMTSWKGWEQRLTHGLGLVALHYGRLGLSKIHVKERMKSALRGMGVDEELIHKYMSTGGDKLITAVMSYNADPRVKSEQNLFISRRVKPVKGAKAKKQHKVDLIGIFKPKLEGEKFNLVYQDINTGERKTISATDKGELSKQFFKKYKRVKIKEEVTGRLEAGEKKIKKPPKKIRDEVEQAIIKNRAITKASERERYSEIEEVSPSEFKLKFLTTKEGETPNTKHGEAIFGLGPGEGMLFKNKAKAEKFASMKWNSTTGDGNVNTASQSFINKMQNKSRALSKLIKENEEWNNYRNLQSSVRGAEKRLGLTDDESIFFRKSISPYSRGKLDNMTPNELSLYNSSMRADVELPELRGLLRPIPLDGIVNNTFDTVMRSKMWAEQIFIPFTTMLRSLKSKGYRMLANNVDMHELDRQSLAGLGATFRNEIMSKYDLSKSEFRKLAPFLDKKHHQFRDKEFESKIGEENLKNIEKDFRTFSDDVYIEMVEAGVEIRKRYGGNNAVFESLFSAFDKAGNYIEPHPSLFIKDPKHPRRKRGHTIFELIARRKKTMLNSEGKLVTVDKIKHNYVKEYSTRIISEGMKKFLSLDDFQMYLAREMIRKDEYLKGLIASGMKRKDVILLARSQVNDLAGYLNNQYPLGTVFARTANLPAALLVNQNGAVIRMGTKANLNVKKGAVVKDAYGREHTVSKIIDVYERDFGKILDRYIGSISQIIPTYRYFGRGGADSKRTLHLLNIGISELEDSKIGKWAHSYIRAKVNGAPRTTLGKILNPFTHGVAWMGLSSPFSGYKNMILGNTQNLSTFGMLTFSNGWARYLANDVLAYIPGSNKTKVYKALATRIGALEVGVHEMLGHKGWDFSVGGMKQTEHFNRYTTIAIGEVALELAIERLAFPEQASAWAKLSMGKPKAASLMKNLFKFKDKEIERIIRLMREYTPPKDRAYNTKAAIYEVLNSPEGLKAKWRERALQNSHLMTQGGPSLSTLPAWMSKDWARPMTLFYRIAYNVTNNVLTNVMKPLHVDGNPYPMLRYTMGATASGASLYALYSLALGKDMINRFQKEEWKYVNYFIRGEGLAVFSNAFDEYGGIFDSYFPVIGRAFDSIYNEVSSVIHGTKTLGQGTYDFAQKNVVVFKHGLDALDTHGTKLMGKTWSGRQLRKKRAESRRMQRDFEKVYFGKEKLFDSSTARLTEKSPYYRAVRDSFWSGDERAKAQAYYSALMYIVHTQEGDSPKHTIGRMTLIKEVKADLDAIITGQRIMPKAWGTRQKGSVISRRNLFFKNITPEEKKDLIYLEHLYTGMKGKWGDALLKYHREMYFPTEGKRY